MPVDFEAYREAAAAGEAVPVDPDSNAWAILSVLAEHPDLGFTPAEIHAQVDLPKGSLNPTLARLEERDLVAHEPPYWSLGDDDRVAALAGTAFSMQAFEERYDDEFEGWAETDADPRTER